MIIKVVIEKSRDMRLVNEIPVGRAFTNGSLIWLKLSKTAISSEGMEISLDLFSWSSPYEVLPEGTKFNITT